MKGDTWSPEGCHAATVPAEEAWRLNNDNLAKAFRPVQLHENKIVKYEISWGIWPWYLLFFWAIKWQQSRCCYWGEVLGEDCLSCKTWCTLTYSLSQQKNPLNFRVSFVGKMGLSLLSCPQTTACFFSSSKQPCRYLWCWRSAHYWISAGWVIALSFHYFLEAFPLSPDPHLTKNPLPKSEPLRILFWSRCNTVDKCSLFSICFFCTYMH